MGLKYSNDDILELQQCVRLEHGAFDVLFGSDECLLAGLCLGVRGAVGCTYNFATPVYQRLIQAFENHDLQTARTEQGKSIDLIKTLGDFGFLAASKTVMAMLGVDCGPVRLPLAQPVISRANRTLRAPLQPRRFPQAAQASRLSDRKRNEPQRRGERRELKTIHTVRKSGNGRHEVVQFLLRELCVSAVGSDADFIRPAG